MIEGGSFNILNTTKPTNNDVVVVFSPAINTQKYEYIIYKDKKQIESKTVDYNTQTSITLDKSGTYQISVKTYDISGKEFEVNSGTYTIDKNAPILTVSKEKIEINKNEGLPNNIASANDDFSGDLTDKITSNKDSIDFSTAGVKTLTYTVSDEAGNIATKNINITVSENGYYLYAIQTIIIILLVLGVYLLAKFRRTINLAKRIEPFTIDSLQTKEPSIIDSMINWYRAKLAKIQPKLKKSIIATKYSQKLDKYASVSSIHQSGMEIFISKIIVAFIFIIIAVFAKASQFKLIASYDLFLPLLVGFFLLDIIYIIKYKTNQNRLENELLSAIIIMNNAFKAGRSITQAIDIVAKETEGRMSNEFSKMSLELSYGLEIDTVFKRFAERIKLEEVSYLTASLTILNKTGGNIIEVFSSIEKTLFNKKKLRLELKSLTSSSKLIVYVLFIVPFLFILFVSIISPGYFMPFINTHLGRILLVVMVIYYCIFIYAVRKIMRVVI